MTELITHLDEIEKPVPELIAQFGAWHRGYGYDTIKISFICMKFS